MKTLAKVVLAASIMATSACRKPNTVDSVNWTTQQQISQSQDSLISGYNLRKWNGSLLVLNSDDGILKTYILQQAEKTWITATSGPVLCLPLSVDPQSNRWLAAQAVMSKDSIQVDFELGSVSSGNGFISESRAVWRGNIASIFGKAGGNASFGGVTDSSVNQPFWGAGFSGPNLYVPYCIRRETIRNRGIIASEGPFACGVFRSTNSGRSWTKEHISASPFESGAVCKTASTYYFIAGRPDLNELHFSRRAADGWTEPSPITRTFAMHEEAVADGNTVHVCWLDQRNERRRSSLIYPWRRNYEVAYCNRKESDAAWSDSVLISKGLLYAFRPVISVEGNKVVIAWAGAKSPPDGHHESSPNDIFFAISMDAGKTWTKPTEVTDGFKAGLSAGRPQVALQNGVIHLFYIQGRMNRKSGSTGLVMMNQPPWPIYYQQRLFPD